MAQKALILCQHAAERKQLRCPIISAILFLAELTSSPLSLMNDDAF
jgi:hypothetical protein